MAYLSNSDLLISDDSFDEALDSLEKDEDFERRLKSASKVFRNPEKKTFNAPPPSVEPVTSVESVESVQREPKHYVPRTRRIKLGPGLAIGIFIIVTALFGALLDRLPSDEPIPDRNVTEIVSEQPDRSDVSEAGADPQSEEETDNNSSEGKELSYPLLFSFTGDDIDQCEKILGCSVEIQDDTVRILSDRSDAELLSSLQTALDGMVDSLNKKNEYFNIKSASAEDTYSEFSVVVTAVNLSHLEEQALRELFAPAALYNSISHSKAQSVRVNCYNMLGNIVNYLDSVDF